ncbi:unnamed protein product [Boreogadus saida]
MSPKSDRSTSTLWIACGHVSLFRTPNTPDINPPEGSGGGPEQTHRRGGENGGKKAFLGGFWGRIWTKFPHRPVRRRHRGHRGLDSTDIMDDSHFNSAYFWSPVPTVQGQIENAMFLNKMKEQLAPEKGGPSPSFPHASSHYPTMEGGPGGGRVVPKQEGGGGGGHHHQPSHNTQNLGGGQGTVSGIMAADKKHDIVPIMPTPGKRGRKRKQVMGRLAGVGGVLPAGSDALILAHLAAGGQHHTADPYDLSNDEDDHANKEGPKSYRCRMCALTFFSKSDMQIHAKSHTEAKPHKCPHCSKSFANSSYLSQHIRIHSGAKPYSCSYCQKAFRQLSHLQQHTRNHTEVKPHKCPHCSKSFSNSGYLSQHIRIHSGAKPYSCSYCQKAFRQLSHLQQHTRIHTGDRPYKCVHPGCEKAFTQLSNLQSHRRQHNKDKPYKCHNCNRGYTDAASLEVHLSTHTVKHAKLYSCGLCNRSYTSETYLMKHMRKHNPDPLAAGGGGVAGGNQPHAPPSGGGGGRGRGRGRGRGGGGRGVSLQNQNQNQNQSPGVSFPPPQQQQQPGGALQCPFDLHQYKALASGELQYKPVGVADLSVGHKDLCLTVSTSAIQVEHMNS